MLIVLLLFPLTVRAGCAVALAAVKAKGAINDSVSGRFHSYGDPALDGPGAGSN
jgi:hypothetical protein